MLAEITPLILTLNEAPNLGRALESVRWAREVIVLDSQSTDDTETVARSFPNVKFLTRPFDRFTEQWNFGVAQAQTDWILSLDADYVVTDELREEMARLSLSAPPVAYFARFRYCIFGRSLRGALYPPRAVLFRKSCCRYVQDGHTQLLSINGESGRLKGTLLHDDRKPFDRWLNSQRNYAKAEADKLIGTRRNGGPRSMADRLRNWIWPAAPAAFIYTLLVKGCLFDGWPGWYYVFQRTYAELLLSLELLDRRLNPTQSSLLPRDNSQTHE